MPHPSLRLDAAQSAFIDKQLTQTKVRAYEEKTLSLKALMLIPPSSEPAPAWANQVEVQFQKEFGQAKIVGNLSDDLPRVDVGTRTETYGVRIVGDMYGFSVDELEKSARLNEPLSTKRARAARRAIDKAIDKYLSIGSSADGLEGFINHSDVTADTVTAGTTWAARRAATPESIVDDLNEHLEEILDVLGDDDLAPTDIVVPTPQFNILNNTRLPDTGRSLLEYFLEKQRAGGYIQRVTSWHRLAGAGSGGADRMIIYRRDPDCVYREVPRPFTQLPEQHRMLETVVPCYASIAGVHFLHPKTARYVDGI